MEWPCLIGSVLCVRRIKRPKHEAHNEQWGTPLMTTLGRYPLLSFIATSMYNIQTWAPWIKYHNNITSVSDIHSSVDKLSPNCVHQCSSPITRQALTSWVTLPLVSGEGGWYDPQPSTQWRQPLGYLPRGGVTLMLELGYSTL